MIFISDSQQTTEELGSKLGQLLTKGSFVSLFGGLGGGKTCFVRGVVEAAAPESAHLVASPTFAIMNEYPGPLPVYHFDMYRLSGSCEIIELGFDDYFHGSGICIIEWSERLGELLPPDRLSITFEQLGDDQRTITIEAYGPIAGNQLQQLETQLRTS